jgi:hypothetical protein
MKYCEAITFEMSLYTFEVMNRIGKAACTHVESVFDYLSQKIESGYTMSQQDRMIWHMSLFSEQNMFQLRSVEF